MSMENEKTKKQQKKMYYSILAIIIALGMFVVWAKKQDKQDTPTIPQGDSPEVIYERFSGISDTGDERDVWMAKKSNEIDSIKQENLELKRTLDKVDAKLERSIRDQVSSQVKDIKESLAKESKEELEKIKKEQLEKFKKEIDNKQKADQFVSKKTTTGSGNVATSPFGNEKKSAVIRQQYYTNPNFDPKAVKNYAPKIDSKPKKQLASLTFTQPIAKVSDSSKNNGVSDAQLTQQVEGEGNGEGSSSTKVYTAKNYVPAGTFVRAILLGGTDAPTGGQSEKSSMPIFLEVEDMAFLPNKYRYDFISCRIIGSAYGDISSERAIARLETMSCIDKNEIVHEMEVKGHIYDESGKVGIRGTLVSKQGQMLANSLIAGIGAGIGRAFNQQATSYSTSALGSVATIDPGAAGMAGLGQGFDSALNRLADYYIDLAEQLFPVIEVAAGRAVDVVFTAGFEINENGGKRSVAQAKNPIPEKVNEGISSFFDTGSIIPMAGSGKTVQ